VTAQYMERTKLFKKLIMFHKLPLLPYSQVFPTSAELFFALNHDECVYRVSFLIMLV